MVRKSMHLSNSGNWRRTRVPTQSAQSVDDLATLESAHAVFELYLWLARKFSVEFKAIEEAKKALDIDIINWPDLDLRNDLEGVAALIANMDCVVSVGTAVAQMAGALGIPLKLLVSRDWVLLGQNQYPWFGNTELFASDILQPVEPLIPQVANQLQNFLRT